MIKIQSLNLCEIVLPLKEVFQISSGFTRDRRIFLLKITDGDGVEVWSECVAGRNPNYSPETIDTAWFAIKTWLAPRILSREFARPEDVHPEFNTDIRGHNMAKAAVEMAVWALFAEKQNRSLAQLLTGTREKIETGISLGIQDNAQALVEKVRQSLEQGYRKIKIKIKPGADIESIRAVREELGETAPIMADANSAYSLRDLDHLKQLDQFGLMMIEQPLAWDDVLQHASLQKHLQTPICLDESVTSLAKAQDMVSLGSGKIINIKPGRLGGLAESLAVHDFSEKHHIPVWCGGMLESGVGRAYNVALASLPNFTIPGDVSPSSRYWQKDIVEPEWMMDKNGMINVPREKPGIGVTVDADRVDNLTVRSEQLESH